MFEHKLYFSATKLSKSDDDFNVYCAESYNDRLDVMTRTLVDLQNLKNKEMLKALSVKQLEEILDIVQQSLSEKKEAN